MANTMMSDFTEKTSGEVDTADKLVMLVDDDNAIMSLANLITVLVANNLIASNATKTLAAGYTCTQYNTYGSSGVVSTGTITPSPANGSEHKYTNGGAHTLAPFAPTAGTAGAVCVEITNNASAGAITTSGFTEVTGSFTTTDAHKFKCFIHVGDAGSYLNIVALQ